MTYTEENLITAAALAGVCDSLEEVAQQVQDEIATSRAVLAVILGNEPTGTIPTR